MEFNWKRRYSFRLTKDDKAIYDYLEQIPTNRRSEAIRKLLSIAVEDSQHKQEQQQLLESLLQEMRVLKENQQIFCKELKNNSSPSQANNQESINNDIEDPIMADTANAFLGSFGFQDDE